MSLSTTQIDADLDLSAIQAAQTANFNSFGAYYYVPAAPQIFDPTVTVEVDAYNGPYGQGYIVIVTSDTDQKVVNFGPETWREIPWTSLD
jgi:hypothetical protein